MVEHEVGKTERSVFEIGQSVAVTLPKKFVASHGIKKGDKVTVSYNSFLLLEPEQKQKILKEIQEKARIIKHATEPTEDAEPKSESKSPSTHVLQAQRGDQL